MQISWQSPTVEIIQGERGLAAERPLPTTQASSADDPVPKVVVQVLHVDISAMNCSSNRGILILMNMNLGTSKRYRV